VTLKKREAALIESNDAGVEAWCLLATEFAKKDDTDGVLRCLEQGRNRMESVAEMCRLAEACAGIGRDRDRAMALLEEAEHRSGLSCLDDADGNLKPMFYEESGLAPILIISAACKDVLDDASRACEILESGYWRVENLNECLMLAKAWLGLSSKEARKCLAKAGDYVKSDADQRKIDALSIGRSGEFAAVDPVAKELLDDIGRSFPKTVLKDLSGALYLDCESFDEGINGQDWTNLTSVFLEFHHDALFHLQPGAFAQLLPAYLSALLEYPDSLDMLPPMLLSALTCKSAGDALFKERISRLNSEQSVLVARTLRTLARSWTHQNHREEIRMALSSHWDELED